MCIAQRPASVCSAISIIFGSPWSPVTSLMISAPAAIAAAATTDLDVSIEIGVLVLVASFSITGMTRSSSWSAATGVL